MADLLRAARAVPEFRRALGLHLVEASPVLAPGAAAPPRRRRTRNRAANRGRHRRPAERSAAADRQRVRRRAADSPTRAHPHRLERTLRRADPDADPESERWSLPRSREVPIRRPGSARIARRAARRGCRDMPGRRHPRRFARRASGAPARPRADSSITAISRAGPATTLAALRRHRPAPVLDAPGKADLSAHVDFAAFAEAARAGGAVSHGPVPQRDFLLALGAEARLAALSRRAAPAQRAALEAASCA